LRALHKRKPQETQALSRNKRKRQPIGMLGQSSGNHDWLLANASACVSCGFHLRNARNASELKRLRLDGNRALVIMHTE